MNLYATCCESAASSLAVTQYPPIAPNRNQVVKLLPQPGHLIGRTQIMPGGTQSQPHKVKQPQQILPKPITPNSPQKQSVSRINTAMPQQTPLLINQPQTQSPTLLLNQVLSSGAPVLVQPAGPGGTVHLMLRTPTPTLQSGPGPPQNKMIIANANQSQPQATVLIQNRQQVVRFMTAQGPMQLQQIQTPSGPQLIAIPQNQSLPFPPNSVLVQGPAPNTLQLQQNTGNTLQLRQSSSGLIQPNSFPQGSLPSQIALSNQIFPANAPSSPGPVCIKRDDKTNSVENLACVPGSNEPKKIVIDNKVNSKKNVNAASSNNNNNSNNSSNNNNNDNSSSINNLNSNASMNAFGSSNNAKKNNKGSKGKPEEDGIGKNFGKVENVDVSPVAVPSTTAPKNTTSSLRQVRPGGLANRNKQNQNAEAKGKLDEITSKNSKSAAPNPELLSSPAKIDNLTATINSVAENIKSPAADDIISDLSLNDVFLADENKSLNLDKRPNLTVVPKQTKGCQPEVDESNISINRLLISPAPGAAAAAATATATLDFRDNYDSLELSGLATASAGVQTMESERFVIESNAALGQSGFQSGQDDGKKGKKAKLCKQKKGKKEENRVDLWDLMKSAGIGDDEFDDPIEMSNFGQDATAIAEPLEISAADSDLLAQLQSASQLPTGLRFIVGDDGRPVFINGSNVLIPDNSSAGSSNAAPDSADADAVLQNMILPDNVFNFTPQAFATAQTQLNQLIQDHGGIATSSADQQLLSQIFGATQSSISNSGASVTNSNTSVIQSSSSASVSNVQSQTMPPVSNDNILVSVTSNSSEVSQPNLVQKQEAKPECIGGPPPGLPPLGPDSLVITNNNGVPTLVASPALMQYLQTHQGIIQFQHDPVTKTIQPSLIIPHPQHKVESSLTQPSSQDGKIDKMVTMVPNNTRLQATPIPEAKARGELRTSVGTATDDNHPTGFSNIITSTASNIGKQNAAKMVKDSSSFYQLTTETNNLINYKERNKNLPEKELAEINKKIQQNRAMLDLMLPAAATQNVTAKEAVTGSKNSKTKTGKQTTETQTLDDLDDLDMKLIKGFHSVPNVSSTPSGSDFQAKFLESIGMGNKAAPKTNVGSGVLTSSPPAPQTDNSLAGKRNRKKREKSQNQATQADVKPDPPNLMFNIAELTPEQNLRLNQALQNRGAVVNHMDNLDAIKQIIQEEVRKITSNAIEYANIRFTTAPGLPVSDADQSIAAGMVLGAANFNQVLDQTSAPGNMISLQGNELIAINSANQQIFTSQNQVISGNHFVASSNQILAIGGSANQLVSLGNPIGSSNPIVALGGAPNLMSVSGGNVSSPGAVIVGSNGNVLAIVQQNPASGPNSGIVQRIQAIQLTTPKQQHFKSLHNQIQTLSSKTNRTQTEQATLQRLIIEQQKIISSGKLVPSGQQLQSMQIVTPQTSNVARLHQTQCAPQQQSQHSQLSQAGCDQSKQSNSQPLHASQTQTFLPVSVTAQPAKSSFTTQTQTCGTNTSEFASSYQSSIPKVSVPPTVHIADAPSSNYGPLYVSPNASGKNVTKCEKGTSPIQIQMGTQTVINMEYRGGKMSTGTMTSPNTGKPQAVVAPAIVIQPSENQSPPYQMKPRNQMSSSEPQGQQVPALSRTAFIEQQMRTDQAGATMPDTRTPFLSKSDACKRLIRYHVMDEKALTPQDLATADDIFEATAQHLLDKFRAMKEKYKYLLMLESMREVSTAERIMVDRNFIIEERIELEELREKEKRLQEEFENPSLIYRNNPDSSFIKTEFTFEDVKKEMKDLMGSEDVKSEPADDYKETMISKGKPVGEANGSDAKDGSMKLTESNRSDDLERIKSETKECKNTRTPGGFGYGDDTYNMSSKCKAKSSRTFSDGSTKSSLDGYKDEDSGADINAQVQSAIDSILNLQKCDTMSEFGEESGGGMAGVARRSKKKRKHREKASENSKRLKVKSCDAKREKGSSGGSGDDCDEDAEEDEEDDEGGGSDGDPVLDEAIRSILTS